MIFFWGRVKFYERIVFEIDNILVMFNLIANFKFMWIFLIIFMISLYEFIFRVEIVKLILEWNY